MLDLLTIFTAVGLQQELDEAHQGKNLMISAEEAEEPSFFEAAADQVSSAMESFDSALSSGFSAILGGGEAQEEAPEPMPAPKKVA
mmetsp:Transcript_96337/g.171198  ORF Transcript_96337/g.171198 Transcript_96337/m.171198 type:complete len:86 (+) Transcript_96337:49-306(+)|eukprot:CAMPEP_0197649978 /NCGR_PEP_ID=MMETSP1338-20131121/30558_1 /TAXON_ID=43686 ORGANISM="Pelagodinium beii, Strain RCC1491" /NCGR_SAMPLE_ID=MMETSP1338 /ASSEMBLY_ACC=CAM_ASM_000754 /LENGTH=85 /DNA_ID=CAMNT_0043224303 /DNA_START=49 /DNA_END=306 /DNA_ORIENTATION=-